MNSLKTLFMMALLAAVGYGAYLHITQNQQQPRSPFGEAPRFGAPTSSISGPGSAAPGFSSPSTSPGLSGGGGGVGAPAYRSAPATTMPGPGNMSGSPQVSMGNSMAAPGGMPGAMTSPADSMAAPVGAAPHACPATGCDLGASVPAGHGTSPAMPGDHALAMNSGAMPSGQMPGGQTPGTEMPMGVTPPSFPGPQTNATASNGFDAQLEAIRRQLDANRLSEAHLALSELYGSAALTEPQSSRARELLDQLAGSVIYSRNHLLEQSYTVEAGETLEQIAQKYSVPWQLLANINGLSDPSRLEPGTELKVVRGPFEAQIRLDRHELVLMVGGRYAGTFAIGVGTDSPVEEGTYVVCNKRTDPEYYGANRGRVAAGSPDNPLGKYWIGLSDRAGGDVRLGLHGTNDEMSLHSTGGPGWVRLGDRDIQDVFAILSLDPAASRVTVTR